MHCQLQGSSKPPCIVETNVNDLWAEEPQQDDEPDHEPAASMTAVSSTLDALSLTQHACANIQHKAFVSLFVRHNRLWTICDTHRRLYASVYAREQGTTGLGRSNLVTSRRCSSLVRLSEPELCQESRKSVSNVYV